MDTINLKRDNSVLYKDKEAIIMSIAKISVRLYDAHNNNYINKWISADEISGAPIEKDVLEEIERVTNNRFRFATQEDCFGVCKDVIAVYFQGEFLTDVTYKHELQNLFSIVEV